MRKPRLIGLVLLVMMIASSVSYAAPMTTNEQSMPRASSTGAHGVNEIFEGISPITGLPWTGAYRPILVQMSNSAQARPHWNISEADVVYESILWGPGHTRYTAIFSDTHPDFVGPVRSARINHCEIREEWDAPLVFYGGQKDAGSSIYEFFKANDVPASMRFDGTMGRSFTKALSRDNTRVAPHNAVANLQMLVSEFWPQNEDGSDYIPKQHAFKFSSSPTRGSDSAQEIHIIYDEKDYYPSYTFNAQDRVYERWYNGEEMVDGKSGKRIVASNVIVQYTEMSYLMKMPSRPLIVMTGGGVFDAFIDGQHIRGTWERKNMKDRTVYMDASGEEITLLPGKTFIQVIPTDMQYKYIRADGSEVVVDVGMEVRKIEMDTSAGSEDIDKMDDTVTQE